MNIKKEFSVNEDIIIEGDYEVLNSDNKIASAVEVSNPIKNQPLIQSVDESKTIPWEKIKNKYLFTEIIEDTNQTSMGIGVLHKGGII